MIFSKVIIKRYRSINNLTLDMEPGLPVVICGANNVGKTNFLRALELYFSLDKNKFNAKKDIPFDIEEGKRGGSYNTAITGFFIDDADKYEVSVIFKKIKEVGNVMEVKAKKNGKEITSKEGENVIKQYRFLFIEASNVNIPKIIAEVIDDEVLPLGLDSLRKNQTEPLKKLQEFIDASKASLTGIEKEIKKTFNKFIIDAPGIDAQDWEFNIIFAEYNKLREALSGLIDFTLFDGNKRKMDAKGSGIQRIVLLSLIKYISDRSKKNILWGIDEPEAFLQPSLQKKTFNVLKDISGKKMVFYTTHSPNFVDISTLDNVNIFEAKYEAKEFARRKNEIFYKVSTFVDKGKKKFEKIQKIKDHLGIMKNDGWEVVDYNIIVEGEEDKLYLTNLMKKFDYSVPNILVSGGSSKMKGYLQFLLEFCDDLEFKPKFVCLFDNDDEGKKEFQSIIKSIQNNKYKKIDLSAEIIPRCDGSTDRTIDYEIEDFVYPDILRDGANKFLKKQNYNLLKSEDIVDRFKPAYNKKCILKLFSEKTKYNNSDKKEIDFEDGNGGVKRIICDKFCKELQRKRIDSLDSKYPEVRNFIKKLSEV